MNLTQKDADKFRKDSKEYMLKATKSRATARNALIKLGIYTKAGKLTKHYRQEPHMPKLPLKDTKHSIGYDSAEIKILPRPELIKKISTEDLKRIFQNAKDKINNELSTSYSEPIKDEALSQVYTLCCMLIEEIEKLEEEC